MAFVGKVAISISYVEPLAHKTAFPSPCRAVGFIHMAARGPGNIVLPPEIPHFRVFQPLQPPPAPSGSF